MLVHLCFIVLYFFFFLMIRRPPRSTLFPYTRSSDLGEATPATALSDPPRCRMCALPAGTKGQPHAPYCGGRSCDNPDRLCQQCGQPFTRRVNGAGNQYCSTECKALGYHPERKPQLISCVGCGSTMPRPKGSHVSRTWHLCIECKESFKYTEDRLRRHHAGGHHIRQLLANPYCDICDEELLTPTRKRMGRGHALLTIDHDHDCCPGSASCGKCIRGFLCGLCNSAIGMLNNDPAL